MLQFVIAGLVLGGLYAIAASGLIVTYVSSGIVNFAFGAIAFAVARFYYFLHTQQNWPLGVSAVLAIVVLGPLIGVFLYFALFRFLRQSSALVKIVATLGVSVAIPSLCLVIFGDQQILTVPGLAPQPVAVYHLFSVPITMDQIIVYGAVVVILVIGGAILRYTDAGLRVRAMVDSPALTSLSATSPGAVSVSVWAVSIGLAGLVGVLAAPIIGLEANDFTLLVVGAFAAVVAARFRSLPIAVVVSFLMGILGSLIQYWIPPTSSFEISVLPSVPFVVTVIFLVYYLARGKVDESAGTGGALDRAIQPLTTELLVSRQDINSNDILVMKPLSWRPPVLGFALVCALPLVMSGFWLGLLGQGVAFGILFLSITLVTGEGGMIWLCQATFAALGGMTMALLAVDHGWPILAALLVGGLVAVPVGLFLAFATARFGNLYVALVTLIFGLLMEDLVFSLNVFQNGGNGFEVSPPQVFGGARIYDWFSLGVFAVASIFVTNLRRSTAGLGLAAVRSTTEGAKTTGISPVQMKMLVAGCSAFFAGIGGGMVALSLGNAVPSNYSTLTGVIWLAVLVTLGIRSNFAALFAGLGYSLSAGVAIAYLPQAFGNVPPILFGLGAIGVAKFPDGTLAMQARQVRIAGQKLKTLASSRKRVARALTPGSSS